MTLTQFIAGLLFAAIPIAYPDYLEPISDDITMSQAFLARCELYVINAGHP